jgi:hypothetical protein
MWPFSKKETEVKKSIDHEPDRTGRMQVHAIEKTPPYYLVNYFNQTNRSYCSESLRLLYSTVTQVNGLINFVALKASEIPIKHVRYQANGKRRWLGETEVQMMVDKIDVEKAIIQHLTQGNLFFQKVLTPGFEYPTRLIIQPSHKFYVIPEKAQDQYGTPSNMIDVFDNPVTAYRKLIENGTLKNYQLSEIIHIKDSQSNLSGIDFYYGQSRLFAATRSITVLASMYDTINTILGAKGALGFISRISRSNEMNIGQYEDSIIEAERRINEDFGTTGGRRSIMVTSQDLKFNRMNAPMSDYLPVELTAQEFSQLCNQLGGIPDILFNAKSNASYNNMREAKAALYENVITPLLKKIFWEISAGLGLTAKREWLEPDFDTVESLQKNRKEEAESIQAQVTYLETLLNRGLISRNDFLEEIGKSRVADPSFDELKEQQNGAIETGFGTSD